MTGFSNARRREPEFFPAVSQQGPSGRVRTIKALIDGEWHDALEESPEVRDRLRHGSGGFHDRVSPNGDTGFDAEPDRYHLYVSYACPWAHRAILYRKLRGLEHIVSMSVLHPRWAVAGGWRFANGPWSTADDVGGRRYLYEIYQAARADYTGRVTVPVLWDCKTGTIVNNESSEIMRMLNSAFDAWGDASVDFYPPRLRTEIDELNAWLIPHVCAGVYRAGFARSQTSYDQAVDKLFACLDRLEKRLTRQPYLLGPRITECDWHLFTTLCRFDAVYVGALKCNLRRLIDYPALSDYTHRLHTIPGVAETVRLDQVRRHYYDAIGEIDPTIVPRGPALDFSGLPGDLARSARAGSSTPPSAAQEAFHREVLELHDYLGAWLRGEIPDREAGPVRLANALGEDFFVIHPNGLREDRAKVIRNFDLAYGQKPAGYALEIGDVDIRPLGDGLCLATYRETHRGEAGRARRSSALLRQRADRAIEWQYLQETFTGD